MAAFVHVLLVGLLCLLSSMAKESLPKVQVYSHSPGEYGKPNTIICHVSNFHPPEIVIELLKDGNVMPKTNQTDLAFEENWHYHLTRFGPFTPNRGEQYACRVTHIGNSKTYYWEADM
ncbi:beta-2-microglobulin-like [Pempheris klunzingeri]|uniref:beta-2-microglobulin-like n=1 Tax=Pempheris klunzingeri TaxID=3127111 RepID=UPI0039801BC6